MVDTYQVELDHLITRPSSQNSCFFVPSCLRGIRSPTSHQLSAIVLSPHPLRQYQQRPDLLAMVDPAAVMLLKELSDGCRLEPGIHLRVAEQALPRPATQLLPKPWPDRYPKALFAARRYLRRELVGKGGLEQPLGLRAAH